MAATSATAPVAPAQPYRAETILAADFGAANTRALLFDVVEGQFRLVAVGEAPSTCAPPFHDASEGLRHALGQLQAITGRVMLDSTARLITPVSSEGQGCDTFVATFSAGAPLKAVLVGLLPEASLRNARRLAESSYLNVLDTLSIVDRRKQEQQIEAIVKARPEVIVLAGGTDGGAQSALLKLAETVGVASFMLPDDQRPAVFYTGNQALQTRIGEMLSGLAGFHPGPNVQPELNRNDLEATRSALGQLVKSLRARHIGGLADLDHYAAGHMYPTAHAEGQVMRFLSRMLNTSRGVLSINLGSASTSVAAAFAGELYLTVASDLGVGLSAQTTLASQPWTEFARWTPQPLTEAEVREFGLWRTAYPFTIPTELEDAQRELALARLALAGALRRARTQWPANALGVRADLLPYFDVLIGGGATLGRAPNPGAAALALLDAVQPTGVTDLMLDRHHALAALGALAAANALASVQVLETDALLRLGVTVSWVSQTPLAEGALLGTATLLDANQKSSTVEVKAGALEVLPLPVGQTGKLTLKPRPGVDVGSGPGRAPSRPIDVDGGAVGLILDGRGRPLTLPAAEAQRLETVQRWWWKLAGA